MLFRDLWGMLEECKLVPSPWFLSWPPWGKSLCHIFWTNILRWLKTKAMDSAQFAEMMNQDKSVLWPVSLQCVTVSETLPVAAFRPGLGLQWLSEHSARVCEGAPLVWCGPLRVACSQVHNYRFCCWFSFGDVCLVTVLCTWTEILHMKL